MGREIGPCFFNQESVNLILSGHNKYLLDLCSHGFMNFVEPIRERKKISQIKNLLRGQYRYLDLLFFVVGIDTALRISDLLELRSLISQIKILE